MRAFLKRFIRTFIQMLPEAGIVSRSLAMDLVINDPDFLFDLEHAIKSSCAL
jgi:hypothetical protein